MKLIPRLLIVTTLVMSSYGCSTQPSPTDGALPAALMLECHRLAKSPTDTVTDVLYTHSKNMERAAKCAQKHRALVEVLKIRENK